MHRDSLQNDHDVSCARGVAEATEHPLSRVEGHAQQQQQQQQQRQQPRQWQQHRRSLITGRPVAEGLEHTGHASSGAGQQGQQQQQGHVVLNARASDGVADVFYSGQQSQASESANNNSALTTEGVEFFWASPEHDQHYQQQSGQPQQPSTVSNGTADLHDRPPAQNSSVGGPSQGTSSAATAQATNGLSASEHGAAQPTEAPKPSIAAAAPNSPSAFSVDSPPYPTVFSSTAPFASDSKEDAVELKSLHNPTFEQQKPPKLRL